MPILLQLYTAHITSLYAAQSTTDDMFELDVSTLVC